MITGSNDSTLFIMVIDGKLFGIAERLDVDSDVWRISLPSGLTVIALSTGERNRFFEVLSELAQPRSPLGRRDVYERDDEPPGGPLPAGVDGFPLGRAARRMWAPRRMRLTV